MMLATSSSPGVEVKVTIRNRIKCRSLVTLFGQGEHPDTVEVLEGVREEVGGDGGAVRHLQVELLQVAALVQAADGRHQHAVVIPGQAAGWEHVRTNIIELGSPLGTEPLDMFGEEERDVLHQLLARQVVVARHLQRAQHLQQRHSWHLAWCPHDGHLVQETFVEVHRDQTEEMGVQQREHLVPHRLLG